MIPLCLQSWWCHPCSTSCSKQAYNTKDRWRVWRNVHLVAWGLLHFEDELPYVVLIALVLLRLEDSYPFAYVMPWTSLMGPSVVEKLFKKLSWLRYYLISMAWTVRFPPIRRFQGKVCWKTCAAIQASRKILQRELLYGLGARHVGAKVSRQLLEAFGSIQVASADVEAIAAVDGLERVVPSASSVGRSSGSS